MAHQVITEELIKKVLEDFRNGIERYKKQDKGFGSIEEKYLLTESECKELFAHPSIKGKKVVDQLTLNKRKVKKMEQNPTENVETLPGLQTNENSQLQHHVEDQLLATSEGIHTDDANIKERIEKMMEYHKEEMKLSVYMEPTEKALEAAFKLKKNIILYGPGGHNKSCYSIDFLGSKGIIPYVITMGQGMNTDRLFGGLDLNVFNSTGKIEYLLENSFMNHEYVIFEEMLDAPDFILEQLKDILSSGVFRNGNQIFPIKTKLIVCCTNKTRQEFGKNSSLKALLERFPYECEVKWKDYNQITYSKLLNSKIGFADPLLVYLLQEFAKKGKIISPRIALLAAETLNELGPDYLNVIADFNEKPDVLKEAITKFKDLAKIKKLFSEIGEIRDFFNTKGLNSSSTPLELSEFKEKTNLLTKKLADLKKLKADEDLIQEVANLTKVVDVLVKKNENDLKVIEQFMSQTAV